MVERTVVERTVVERTVVETTVVETTSGGKHLSPNFRSVILSSYPPLHTWNLEFKIRILFFKCIIYNNKEYVVTQISLTPKPHLKVNRI